MEENDKKLLTEFLGECWYEWLPDINATLKCRLCGKWIYENNAFEGCNLRTFKSWQDLGDLKEKLIDKGGWADFYRWAILKTPKETEHYVFSAWLLNPGRFCQLVAIFISDSREV